MAVIIFSDIIPVGNVQGAEADIIPAGTVSASIVIPMQVPVTWHSLDFNSGVLGVYTFTAAVGAGFIALVEPPAITVTVLSIMIVTAAALRTNTVDSYADLQNVTAAGGTGDIVKLGGDIADGATLLTIARDLTLDLNGRTLNDFFGGPELNGLLSHHIQWH